MSLTCNNDESYIVHEIATRIFKPNKCIHIVGLLDSFELQISI